MRGSGTRAERVATESVGRIRRSRARRIRRSPPSRGKGNGQYAGARGSPGKRVHL